ncbi:hypothetical protein CYG49_03315 [Candidatus Saccharibacteria bacterium]|nr:MAG: hypothetical protein CYG49_03315 [Candidatus Saccharibacteria bacterium]
MPLRVGLVVPHIFMHEAILPHVLFSPGELALNLANGLVKEGIHVTLLTPGPVRTSAATVTADLSLFERELAGRGDTYVDLLKKHPFTFVTLARQVQSELVAKAYEMANSNELDIIHIYTNEEEIALPFASLCNKPVVLTHHDPYNFLIKYKSVFPKYKHLNWLSMSLAQRSSMPEGTNWVANIYHGIDPLHYQPSTNPTADYLVFLGRIISPKGLDIAIGALKSYNRTHHTKYKLKIAGKHYAGKKDAYWQDQIMPHIDGDEVQFLGFIRDTKEKAELLKNAAALLIPSTFEEPFGMVMIESLACGTPIIGLDSGAIPEVIEDGKTGIIVQKQLQDITATNGNALDREATVAAFTKAIEGIEHLDRGVCRISFERRFTLDRMVKEHLQAYQRLVTGSPGEL